MVEILNMEKYKKHLAYRQGLINGKLQSILVWQTACIPILGPSFSNHNALGNIFKLL